MALNRPLNPKWPLMPLEDTLWSSVYTLPFCIFWFYHQELILPVYRQPHHSWGCVCSSAFGGFISLIRETTEPWIPAVSAPLFPLFSVAVNQALLLYIECCILLLYSECRSDARYPCLLQGLDGSKIYVYNTEYSALNQIFEKLFYIKKHMHPEYVFPHASALFCLAQNIWASPKTSLIRTFILRTKSSR